MSERMLSLCRRRRGAARRGPAPVLAAPAQAAELTRSAASAPTPETWPCTPTVPTACPPARPPSCCCTAAPRTPTATSPTAAGARSPTAGGSPSSSRSSARQQLHLVLQLLRDRRHRAGQGEALSIRHMVALRGEHLVGPAAPGLRQRAVGRRRDERGHARHLPGRLRRPARSSPGIPYRCATSMVNAFSCMNPGVDKTPAQWGDLVRGAFSGYAGAAPEGGDLARHVRPHRRAAQRHRVARPVDQRAGVSATPDRHRGVARPNHAGAVRQRPRAALPGRPAWATARRSTRAARRDQCGTAAAYFLDTICSTYHDAVSSD